MNKKGGKFRGKNQERSSKNLRIHQAGNTSGSENIGGGQEWCLLLPSESFTVGAYQFITLYQEIHRISKCYSRFYMLLDGRVIMEWRIVKR